MSDRLPSLLKRRSANQGREFDQSGHNIFDYLLINDFSSMRKLVSSA